MWINFIMKDIRLWDDILTRESIDIFRCWYKIQYWWCMLHLSLMLFMEIRNFVIFLLHLQNVKMISVLWYHTDQTDEWFLTKIAIPCSQYLFPGWLWVHSGWKQEQGKELKEPQKDCRNKDFTNRNKQKTTCCILKVHSLKYVWLKDFSPSNIFLDQTQPLCVQLKIAQL